MEIKMEKSITMLMLSLKISACLESQEPFTHICSISSCMFLYVGAVLRSGTLIGCS